MNIYVLDKDPRLAAQYHNDRHVVKMILETCQLLATVHHLIDGCSDWHDPRLVPMHPTNLRHPCVLWAASGPREYEWAAQLLAALISEHTARYGRAHSYEPVAGRLQALPHGMGRVGAALPGARRGQPVRWASPAPTGHPVQPHPLCMPEQYKVPGNPVGSYRSYYFHTKQHMAVWYHGEQTRIPEWWLQMRSSYGVKAGSVD